MNIQNVAKGDKIAIRDKTGNILARGVVSKRQDITDDGTYIEIDEDPKNQQVQYKQGVYNGEPYSWLRRVDEFSGDVYDIEAEQPSLTFLST